MGKIALKLGTTNLRTGKTTLKVTNVGTDPVDVTNFTTQRNKPTVAPGEVEILAKWPFTLKPNKSKTVRVVRLGIAACDVTITVSGKTFTSAKARVTGAAGTGKPVGGACFTPETRVMLASGEFRRIDAMQPGDLIRTIDEVLHLTDKPRLGEAKVEKVLRHDETRALLEIAGVQCTPEHPWAAHARGEPRFIEAEKLDGATVRAVRASGAIFWEPVQVRQTERVVPEVWNLETSARTYLVTTDAEGPYFLVHNLKPRPKNPRPGQKPKI